MRATLGNPVQVAVLPQHRCAAVEMVEARSLLKAHAAFRVTASPLPAQICVAGVSQGLGAIAGG